MPATWLTIKKKQGQTLHGSTAIDGQKVRNQAPIHKQTDKRIAKQTVKPSKIICNNEIIFPGRR